MFQLEIVPVFSNAVIIIIIITYFLLIYFLLTYYLPPYLLTAIELSLGGSSPYTSTVAAVPTPVQKKQIRINLLTRNKTKTQYKQHKTQ
jgi:hypothetical protein